MRPTGSPSDFELQILGVLWSHGPRNVRQVMVALPDKKKRAYTSVLSVLQVMERKGLVAHRVVGQTNVYRARVTEGKTLQTVLGRLVTHVFGGRPAAAVQQLLRQGDMAPADVAEIRQILDDFSGQKGD